MTTSSKLKKRIISGLIMAPLAVALLAHWIVLMLGAAFVVYVVCSEVGKTYRTAKPKMQKRALPWLVSFLAVVLVGAVGIVALRSNSDSGLLLTATLLMATAIADIGGLVFGMLIGGPKLWHKVSPKKTWAGFFGGWLVSAGVVYGAWLLSDQDIASSWFIWLALTLGPISVAGDLLASWTKRCLDADDFSDLIPGHGGAADRVDSHVAVYAVWSWLFILFVL